MQNLVSIDGKYYNISIPGNGIRRSFAVTDTDNSGRNISGEMLRDIIGTYYNYTIQFNTKQLNPAEYDDLYELVFDGYEVLYVLKNGFENERMIEFFIKNLTINKKKIKNRMKEV